MRDKLLFLREYVPIVAKIRLLDSCRKEAKEDAYTITSFCFGSREDTGVFERLERSQTIIRNCDRQIEQLEAKAKQIIASINAVGNEVYREILINCFILGKEVSPVLLARAVKEVQVFGYDNTPKEKAKRMLSEHIGRKH